MRHFFLLILLALAAKLPATARTFLLADTVPGQAQFVRTLTATLCTKIEESGRTRPFEQLTPKEADALLMQLMVAGMSEQSAGFVAMMGEAEKRGMSGNQLGQSVGQATVMQLSAACPGSMALVMRTSSAQQAAGSQAQNMNNISAAEKAVLQPMADSACAQLVAVDAQHSLKQLSAPARKQAMMLAMQLVMVRNMPSLLKLYSAEQLADKPTMEGMGVKLASLMATQCPSYLIMLGLDEANQKAAAARAKPAASKTAKKPTPAPKAVRRPAPNKEVAK